jgi:hypothetical protein
MKQCNWISRKPSIVKNSVKRCNDVCIESDCKTYSVFNYEDQMKGIYCYKHKLEDMVNVKMKRCSNSKCSQLARFNFHNKKPLYCLEHKSDNMVSNDKKIDKIIL